MDDEPRCLSTLVELEEEGYSAAALELLSDGAPLAPRLDFSRAEFIEIRQEATRRISISGVQDKLSLRLEEGRLVPTSEGGTYILKPTPGAQLPRWGAEVPANEHLTMQIARQVFGLEVAANALIRMSDGELAYITRRFDRDAQGHKIPQEDFCQLMERSARRDGEHYKYDASYEEVAQALERFSAVYMIERERLFAMLCFNYLIANGDAHLKNFSLRKVGDVYRLTPAYDLICTKLHLPNEHRLALDLLADDEPYRDQETHGFPTGNSWLEFARVIGIRDRRALKLLRSFCDPSRLEQLKHLVERSFLSAPARRAYLDIVRDRRRALLLCEHDLG